MPAFTFTGGENNFGGFNMGTWNGAFLITLMQSASTTVVDSATEITFTNGTTVLHAFGTSFGGFDANGSPHSGTVTSFDYSFFNAFNAQITMTVTGLNVAAADLTLWATTDNVTALENALFGGADQMTGGDFKEALYGYGGNDSIDGGGGDDSLVGGLGNDTLSGGAGNDNIDSLGLHEGIDSLLGGDGDDTLGSAGGGDTLDGGVGTDTAEVTIMTGNAAVTTVGMSTDVGDTLGDGTVLRNVELLSLSTGAGDDTLTVDRVATFGDRWFAGDGVDTFIGDFSSATDTINANTGGVAFWQLSSVDRFVVASGSGSDTLTGGSFNDSFSGGAGVDFLTGNGGDDTLDGGAGNDNLTGGAGNDTYTVDSASDVVTENTSEGTDIELITLGSATLGANVENGTLLAGSLGLTGNGLDNVLTGNAANNTMNGGDGADTITGGNGDDSIAGGAGNDLLDGGAGFDLVDGGDGDDTVDGGAGGDDVRGGDGNDVLVVHGPLGIPESYDGGAGYDTLEIASSTALFTSASRTINSIEALSFTGTGNSASFYVTQIGAGLAADATISGDDRSNSILLEIQSAGAYAVADFHFTFVNWSADDFLQLVALDAGNHLLTGSAAKDRLQAYLGDDTLLGGDGDDLLQGGGGADVLDGGAGVDTLIFNTVSNGISSNPLSGGSFFYITSDLSTSTFTNMERIDFVGGGLATWGILHSSQLAGFTAPPTVVGSANSANQTTILEIQMDGTSVDLSGLTFSNWDSVTDWSTVSTALTLYQSTLDAVAITGTNGDDSIIGSISADVIFGDASDPGAGADTIHGGNGSDLINGGGGADQLHGDAGDDTLIVSTTDAAVIDGGDGLDTLQVNGQLVLANAAISGIERIVLAPVATENVTYAGLTLTALPTLEIVGSSAADWLDLETSVSGVIDLSAWTLTNWSADDYLSLGLAGAAANVTGTTGADGLLGGQGGDTLTGGNGDDFIIGDAQASWQGHDILSGGAGNDTIAGNGFDEISAGVGDDDVHLTDFYSSYAGAADGGDGIDTIVIDAAPGRSGFDLGNATLTNFEGLRFGNALGFNSLSAYFTTARFFSAFTQPPTITGSAIQDTLTLDGSLNPTGMTIDASTWTLLSWSANDILILDGSQHNDTLIGTTANDALEGNAGADTMAGGLGNDTYTVDNAGDVVTEALNAGTDGVSSKISYTLTANVENLTLIGVGGLSGTGNNLNNVITGNDGGNTLDGKAGADTLIGGLGNDIYVVDNAGDVVTESAGQGTDTIRSTVGIGTLVANVENLELQGSAITGNGNELSNRITANASNNNINGGLGADTMLGGLGNDTYFVDNVADLVNEAAGEGTDTIFSTISIALLSANVENLSLNGVDAVTATGNSLNNTITGNSTNNTLNGGAGEDTLNGGLGNDTYLVNSAGDVVNDSGGNSDTILSFIDMATLTANIENLTLAGTALIGGGNELNNVIVGNGLDNTLSGGLGNDQLNGATGADTMSGGLGDDSYLVENSGDVVIENNGEGADTMYAFITISALAANVEKLTLMPAAGAIDGTANDLDNRLNGNDFANTLTALGGNDVIQGLGGNDHIIGGAGLDNIFGGTGNDVFVYQLTSDSGTTGAARDLINDFTQGQDTIDLSAIDAIAGGGDDAFSFNGLGALTHTAGEVRYTLVDAAGAANDFTIISMDVNGDGVADSQIALRGLVTLTSADFVL